MCMSKHRINCLVFEKFQGYFSFCQSLETIESAAASFPPQSAALSLFFFFFKIY